MNFEKAKEIMGTAVKEVVEGNDKLLCVVGLCTPEYIDTLLYGFGTDADIVEIIYTLINRYNEEHGGSLYLGSSKEIPGIMN